MISRTKLKIPVTTHDHSRGEENAPLTLVEYGDYECPFCARAHLAIKALEKHFAGKLRYVFRHFPLVDMHAHALPAAKAAEAAAAQGKFWAMHERLFARRRELDQEGLLRSAGAVGLNLERYAADVGSLITEQRIWSQMDGGVKSGVHGTPSFYINGYRYEGSASYDSLAETLQTVLETEVRRVA